MANQNNQISPSASNHQATPGMIEKIIALQEKEVEVRAQEMVVRSKQEDSYKSIAEASIAANLQDRKDERAHIERKTKTLCLFSGVVVLIIVGFSAYAISLGKGDLVMKIFELTSIFVAGFAGGYGAKAAKSGSSSNQEKFDE